MSSKRRGIVNESLVELCVLEGGKKVGREVGNFWFIEVLTHLKMTKLVYFGPLISNFEKLIGRFMSINLFCMQK